MIWKAIKGFENYEINTNGDVRSKRRSGAKGGIIKPFFDRKNNGYLKVHIYKNGKQYQPFVHRIVAETFLPMVVGKPEVNHKDGVKTNNNVDNLEWCSRKENINHSYEHQLRKTKKVGQFKDGKLIATYRSCHYAYVKTGIQCASIYWCIGGIFKQAGGYEWKYVD